MVRNAIVYLASSAAGRAIGLLLLPVVTHYLAPADYGAWAVYSSCLALVGCFVGLNLHGNITRKFFRLPVAELPGYAGNVLLALGGSFVAGSALWFLIVAFWPGLSGISLPWLLVLPAIAVAQMAIQVNQTYYRCREQPFRFAALELGLTLLAAGVTLPLLIIHGWGWEAQAMGLAVSSIVLAGVSLALLRLRRDIKWAPRAGDLREIMVVSVPQIPHVLGFMVLLNSDRLLLTHFVGPDATGVYAIGVTLASPVLLLSEGVFKAWTPWLYRLLGENRDEVTAKAAAARGAWGALGALAILAAVYVALMLAAFPYLVNDRYAHARDVFPVIAFAFWLRAPYQAAFSFLLYAGNTLPLLKANLLAGAVNIAANLILIPALGLWSAPISMIAGFATLALSAMIYQTRYFPVPWLAALRAR